MASRTVSASRTRRPRLTMAQKADPHALYQDSVQCAEAEIDFVDDVYRKLRRRRAMTLREDFCGTALVCCEWVRRRSGNIAFGVDLDGTVLEWGSEHNIAKLRPATRQRISLIHDDVMKVKLRPVDAILAMNFSYWLFKQRAELRAYFERVHAGLARDGVFFLDCYGGHDAFKVVRERTPQKRYTYIWHQAAYNPVNGDYTCHISFSFPDGSRLPNAFTYHWRLWTLPEIREVLAEAGFSRSTVYWQAWDEKRNEVSGEFFPTEEGEADPGWLAYIVAEK